MNNVQDNKEFSGKPKPTPPPPPPKMPQPLLIKEGEAPKTRPVPKTY